MIKPVVIVAPDGCFLEIQGPYFGDGRNNDASILASELERDRQQMEHWFQRGDVLVLDRGYRDSVNGLQQRGIIVKMPPLLAPGQKQFSTGK